MPIDQALREKKRQLLGFVDKEVSKGISILTGDASDAKLTLVLIGCVQNVYDELLESLIKLLEKYPYLSLHLSPGVMNIHFVLSGMLPNRLWVYRNLITKAKDHQVGIHAIDLKPTRLRWVDQMHGDGPMRIQRTTVPEDARDWIRNGGRWLNEPSRGDSYYLFFGAAPRMVERAQHCLKPLIRDLYEVEVTSQDDGVAQLTNPYGLFAKQDELKRIHMVGLVRIDEELLREFARHRVETSPATTYRVLTAWRKEFQTHTDASVDFIRIDPFRESDDFIDDPNMIWQEHLNGAKIQKRLNVGWIGDAAAQPAPTAPGFEVERMTTVVLGQPRTGKSIIAYHLLSRYLQLEGKFTTVLWNCKEGDEHSTAPGSSSNGDRPRLPKGLLDFAAVVQETTRQPVIASKPSDLSAAFKKYGAGRAYYTELDPGHAPSAAVCAELGTKIGARFVFCFDEIVNRNPHDVLMKYLGKMFKQGGECDYYVMLIHQVMGELFTNSDQFVEMHEEQLRATWPGLPDAACYFLKTLGTKDEPLFKKYCRDRKPFLDHEFQPFQELDYRKVGVLQPYRKSAEKAIPISVPGYSKIPDENVKQGLKNKVQWGEVDFERLLKQA
ncbi:MAG TPA: hypothetical protein VGQ36_15110 [Thermoanaerobaculia bacterium]|jgi:hypothetical protein|nr:hypothetical protein [Thermoanaerobaculia bacterium]